MAEFWVEPGAGRDLYWGPWGKANAPDAASIFEFKKADSGGFSPGWDVTGPGGREWSVKMGPEAQSEVTASRILWGVGYHQPPNYYLERWRVKREGRVGNGSPGRFRPDLPGLERDGDWAWRENPFLDTPQYRGLLVLLMMLNSTDLKDDNNAVYTLRRAREGARRWHVVRDLGSSLGETAWEPRRNDIDLFERHPFITGVEDGFLRFQDRGRHSSLLERLRPADAGWISERLQRLTPKQWRDAFRAGGYDQATTDRYIRKIREKIDQGLAVAREHRKPVTSAAPAGETKRVRARGRTSR
jgi:hypothetical protein